MILIALSAIFFATSQDPAIACPTAAMCLQRSGLSWSEQLHHIPSASTITWRHRNAKVPDLTLQRLLLFFLVLPGSSERVRPFPIMAATALRCPAVLVFDAVNKPNWI